jgi:hypothetical protein
MTTLPSVILKAPPFGRGWGGLFANRLQPASINSLVQIIVMRVLCIDATNPLEPDKLSKHDWIYEGEIYTVKTSFGMNKNIFYLLVERPGVNYLAKRFIPLEDDDCEELLEVSDNDLEKMDVRAKAAGM